jgi:RNA polymerase sigma-32 factor
MAELEQGDLSPEVVTEIATELAVPEQDVVDMNRRLAAADQSLNVTLSADGDSEWLELLADQRPTHDLVIADGEELRQRRGLLEQAMAHLNARERHIIEERRLKDDPLTLEELSQQYDVSRERIRQIEARAFEKLQKAVLQAANAPRVDILEAA